MMFIKNKRVITPDYVKIDDTIIKAVNKFKLLGVTLDEKLNFGDFIASQRLAINRRLYSIRRIFYLPFDVKLLFFKTFILPCFDYCASLSIYFNKKSLQKLNRSYYYVLHKLLGIRCDGEADANMNLRLEVYGLQVFRNRLITRILEFVGKITCNKNAPETLKYDLAQASENLFYGLRSNNKVLVLTSSHKTKFGEIIFRNIGAKIINKLSCFLSFYDDFKVFKNELYIFQDNIMEKFVNQFPKFSFENNIIFFK